MTFDYDKMPDEFISSEERDARIERDNAECARLVQESRSISEPSLDKDTIVAGFKFIIENHTLDHISFVQVLLALGCNWTREDIDKEFPGDLLQTAKGMEIGDLKTGAVFIRNVLDNELFRFYLTSYYLESDGLYSLYNFVRVTTNDPSYNAEYVHSLDIGISFCFNK